MQLCQILITNFPNNAFQIIAIAATKQSYISLPVYTIYTTPLRYSITTLFWTKTNVVDFGNLQLSHLISHPLKKLEKNVQSDFYESIDNENKYVNYWLIQAK